MTKDRLALAFHLVTAAIQSGNFAATIDAVRSRPALPTSDVTDDEIAELMGMTLRELAERLKPTD